MISHLHHGIPFLRGTLATSGSWDSSVGIATGLNAEGSSRPSRAHTAFYPVGTGGSFPEVKQPGREPEH
jgi:hypothetical protein